MSATQGGAAPLLEVADLRTHYGRIQALHGVSLSVPRGSLVALVGPTGPARRRCCA
jgi:branched-chain amino acid transport system ATP-binding protein